MAPKEKLHRRIIRSALKGETGWDVVSHIDGTITVYAPSSGAVSPEFREELLERVRNLNYEPRIIGERDANGRACIRFHTPETLAQCGRGAHGTG